MTDQHPARAYLGLALAGWGLSILLQVAPHEDPFVGLGLLLLGGALFLTASRKPRILMLRPWPVIAAGVVAASAILAYDAVRGASLGVTKAAILVYGLLLVASGVLLARRGLSTRARGRLSTAVACSVPAVAAPLLAWSLQATFKAAAGTTPVEAFVHFALLVPLRAALVLAGWNPVVQGQSITYGTPTGPLTLNVGAACSGLQAMALFGAVIALYLFMERPTAGSLAVWSAIGIFGVYLANLERIVVLVAVGYRWGPAALLQVHEQAGWLFFVAWSVLFAALVRTRSPPQKGQAPPAPNSGATMFQQSTGTPGFPEHVRAERPSGPTLSLSGYEEPGRATEESGQ